MSAAATCGIYSRQHQGAVPDRLRIVNNYVSACGASAIRIIGSKAGDRTAKVDLHLLNNRLYARKHQSAFRIENVDVSFASGNGGIGSVQGSPKFAADWRKMKASDETNGPKVPDLANHPAWNFLDPLEVSARLLSQ